MGPPLADVGQARFTVTEAAQPQAPTVVIGAEQIRDRIRQLARQISDDYRGTTLYCVGVLEDGFIFMADLVRELDVAVICQFIKPEHQEIPQGAGTATEIFFSPEVNVPGAHVLLVQGLVETGITSEFLMRNLLARGAASVKLAALLDRPSSRRISLQPEYVGFTVDDRYVFGYGLGAPELSRNLPYVASRSQGASVSG
jgi:hypoxanthine phosphoribosyltransferase